MKQVVVVTIVFFLSNILLAQADWKFTKEKNGVKVYTRDKAGFEVKEFKANITAKGYDFEKVCSILLDSDNGEHWLANVEEAKILKRESESKTTSYFKLTLPWPFDNRDMILQHDIKKEPGQLYIGMTSAPEEIPEEEGVVRMTKAEGSWVIKKLENGDVDIEYIFVGEPAGSVPVWVINMFIVDGPLTSISNLLERSKSI